MNTCPPAPSPVHRLLAGGSLLFALAAPCLIQAQTPLIRYNLDEGSYNAPWAESSVNSGSLGSSANLNFTGTYSSHITWANPENTVSGTGSALISDGTTRSAQPGFLNADGTGINGLSSFTVSLWVNLSQITAGDRWVAFFNSTAGFALDVGTVTGTSANLKLFVDGLATANTANSSTQANVVNQWTFIAVTYDGTQSLDNVSFYTGTQSISASALGTTQTVNQGTVDAVSLPTQALRINGSAATSADRASTGMFDDIRIYGSAIDGSGALSLAQIQAIQASAIPEPSSVALIFAGVSLVAAGVLRRRRR